MHTEVLKKVGLYCRYNVNIYSELYFKINAHLY